MNLMPAFIVPALLALASQAQDPIRYSGWADFKVGSSVTFKRESEAGGVKLLEETTQTLLELSTEQAVVEKKQKATVAGKAQSERIVKLTHRKDKEVYPIKVDKEGDEEIAVGGQKLKCHWVEGSLDGTLKLKFWHTKEIPGGLGPLPALRRPPPSAAPFRPRSGRRSE